MYENRLANLEEGDDVDFEDLKNPELQERLRAAKTPEELLAIAKEQGYTLSDDQLESVSGGAWCENYCNDFYYCKNDGSL